jgi:FixJ family two-component response regulator
MATAGCSPEIPLLAIVDDDTSIRISTQRLIRSLGFRAEVFASAQEFLKSGCAQGTACLILDLRLPGMDGLQLKPNEPKESRKNQECLCCRKPN